MSQGSKQKFRRERSITKGVFSSENSSASTGKKEVRCIPKACFQGKRKGGKERGEKTCTPKIFPVCVCVCVWGGDLFAQHWCIDFGLLKFMRMEEVCKHFRIWGGLRPLVKGLAKDFQYPGLQAFHAEPTKNKLE